MKKHFFVLLAALAALSLAFTGCDDEKTPETVAVTGVKLNQSELSLVVGGQGQLTATVEPNDAESTEVVWESDSKDIATVADGVVTAVAEGQAVITVTTVEGDFTAKCTVIVTTEKVPVEVVILSEELLELTVGDEPVKLEYELRPQGSEAEVIEWSSEDENVATVIDGSVTAIDAGTTTITLNVDGITDECTVIVTDKAIAVESVELSEETLALAVGDAPATLTYALFPEGAAGVSIQWSSEDNNIATVADGVVTAVGRGTTNVTINVDGKTDVCEVTVTAEHPIFGDISFKTASVWEIRNANGDVIQTWSDAVMGTRCNKDELDGGTPGTGPFNADCRQNPGYGDLFTWEAVNLYKADLCPDGWAVPTSQDFLDLHAVMEPIATAEGVFAGQIYVREWGGELGGMFQNRLSDQGTAGWYWSQTQYDAGLAIALKMYTNYYGVSPNDKYNTKVAGMVVRCVKK